MMWNIFHEHLFWGMRSFWWFFWLIIILWAFSTSRKNQYQQTNDETPLDILKKRFAKGEINKDEYEDIKKTLNKD